jgi:glutaredoxin
MLASALVRCQAFECIVLTHTIIMIELFVKEYCPYCIKVQKFIEENNVEVVIRDIMDESQRARLIDLGGKQQVPFLYCDDKNIAMYESDDIIDYLKNAT